MSLICALWGHRVRCVEVSRAIPRSQTRDVFLSLPKSGSWEYLGFYLSLVPEETRFTGASCPIAEPVFQITCSHCGVLEELRQGEGSVVPVEWDMNEENTGRTVGPLRQLLRTYACLFLGHDEYWRPSFVFHAWTRECRACHRGQPLSEAISDKYLHEHPELARAMGIA